MTQSEENGLIATDGLWLLPMPQIIFSTSVLNSDYKAAPQIIYEDLLEG